MRASESARHTQNVDQNPIVFSVVFHHCDPALAMLLSQVTRCPLINFWGGGGGGGGHTMSRGSYGHS